MPAPVRFFFVLLVALLAGGISIAGNAWNERPAADAGPTGIDVDLYIIDVEKVDDVAQTFTARCALNLRWKDERVTAGAVALENAWTPNIGIANLRSSESGVDSFVQVLDDGSIQKTEMFRGVFASRLDLRRFPFDRQTLQITVMAFSATAGEVELGIDLVGAEPSFSIPGWTVGMRDTTNEPVSATRIGNNEFDPRPAIQVRLDAQRSASFYRWRALVPLSLIVFLSWGVFWIDPENLNPQIAVASTSILTLIAYMWSLSDLLPQVEHLTRLDKFVFACLCLVLAAYVEALITARLAIHPDKLKRARGLDLFSRAAFPVAYAALLIIYWI